MVFQTRPVPAALYHPIRAHPQLVSPKQRCKFELIHIHMDILCFVIPTFLIIQLIIPHGQVDSAANCQSIPLEVKTSFEGTKTHEHYIARRFELNLN